MPINVNVNGEWKSLIPSPSNKLPLPSGIANPGVSQNYSREDHVHPKNTVSSSSVVIAKPTITGPDKILAGKSGVFNFSASSGINSTISKFLVTASGATNDSMEVTSSYTLNVPSSATKNSTITLSVVAIDNYNNQSVPTTKTVTVDVAFINQPSITAPQNGSEVMISSGLTVSTSAFSVTGGTDTHKNTDWVISSDSSRNNIVAQALASSDKTSHTFTSSNLSSMTNGNNYYISARHRGNNLGESAWAVPVQVAAKSGQVAPGNRTVYRHSTLPGSVIEYNEFGTAKKILVFDAAYRSVKKFGQYNVDIPGLNNWPHYYYPTCTGNVIDSSSGYTNLSQVADLTPYSEQFSDAHFQAALTATLKPVLQSAKAATDILMNYSDTDAAHWCREQGQIAGIEGQLPNIYQLLVMYACGDVIDSLDPTVASHANYALGKYGTNTYRWYLGVDYLALSSTEYSATRACRMNGNGGTNYSTKTTTTCGVSPIAELN